ncbi:MAG TPA: DNA mismatch repair protein MutS [Nitrospirota bacterium]|nr:DNA mismatch repair protein MutS [Nitrospirota bacterium]
MSNDTPLMRQYREIKKKHPGSILFFRMGDFYEMFGEDALVASKALEITLTTRNRNQEEKIPLCGVPYHAADGYIAKLIRKGYKVAVCEQVEDPRTAKGIVKREVVRVITPGTLLEDNLLSASDNNFLMALAPLKRKLGLSFMDISTGEFFLAEFGESEQARLMDELERIDPKELLLPKGAAAKESLAEVYRRYKERACLMDDWAFDHENGRQKLLDHFKVGSLDGFGVEGMDAALAASCAAFTYLSETQAAALTNITRVREYNPGLYMVVDESARRNLEIFESPSGRDGTLIGCLDRTVTSMGARKLKGWLMRPLLDMDEIRKRQEAVAELAENYSTREALRDNLRGVYDLERLMGRICSGVAGPRDLSALRNSLTLIPLVRATVAEAGSLRISELKSLLSDHADLRGLLEKAVVDDPPATLRDGGVIRQGYNPDLDELRGYSREGKGLIAKIEAEERIKTGIDSLKVRYNKVFGYYIEITRSHLARVPDYFIRKQTLVNAERFVTPELKEYEEKVLGAEERILEIEASAFAVLRDEVAMHAAGVQSTAGVLAEMDALASFADAAAARDYARPEVDDGDAIEIRDGRHPVVEEIVGRERYIPNDAYIDPEQRLLIITGPNMAGKSTFMRQVALIALMAHTGSFVPAKSARIGLVDRIFTRVGASDNIARGQSTFMVEMNETANILNNATARSLIILDEIGRGTSTFDGLSIAWAVAEYIHDRARVGARTLFATHYHELTELAATCPGIKNYNIAVREWKDEIVFLRKIVEGGADKSYGIQVARLAGLPREVVERAKEILANLENKEYDETGKPTIAKPKDDGAAPQMDIFAAKTDYALADELAGLDLVNMTPMQAMGLLGELAEKAARLRGGRE